MRWRGRAARSMARLVARLRARIRRPNAAEPRYPRQAGGAAPPLPKKLCFVSSIEHRLFLPPCGFRSRLPSAWPRWRLSPWAARNGRRAQPLCAFKTTITHSGPPADCHKALIFWPRFISHLSHLSFEGNCAFVQDEPRLGDRSQGRGEGTPPSGLLKGRRRRSSTAAASIFCLARAHTMSLHPCVC